MSFWHRHTKSELRASIRTRRRWKARSRRAAASKRAVLAALDPSEESPIRPTPVERTGPLSPPVAGKRGRRYQVVELGEGTYGVRVAARPTAR